MIPDHDRSTTVPDWQYREKNIFIWSHSPEADQGIKGLHEKSTENPYTQHSAQIICQFSDIQQDPKKEPQEQYCTYTDT